MPNKEKEPTYSDMFINDATRVGTNASRRLTASQLQQQETDRQQQAVDIQRASTGAGFAEMAQKAQGEFARQQMAGTTPGLTGGVAQQRTEEISGAQMRAFGQLSGQREQAMREISFQETQIPQRAFDFAQQQVFAQRDEQMFNLQMIQSREEISKGDMSDEGKLAALIETGMDPQEAQQLLDESDMKKFTTRLKTGNLKAGDFFIGGPAAAYAAKTAQKYGAKAAGKGFLVKAPKLAKAAKFAVGAGKFALGVKFAIPIAAALIVVGGMYGLSKFLENR